MIDNAHQAEFDQLLQEIIGQNFSVLPDKPEETPESVLKALWLLAAGHPMSAVVALESELENLSEPQIAQLHHWLAEWQNGRPLAHITGRQHFAGLELQVGPEALIPRKQTEKLAQVAIEVLSSMQLELPIIADICTGCGNIALVLARRFPKATIQALDVSSDAIGLAQRNAKALGVSSQVIFQTGDLLQPLEQQSLHHSLDMMTCNPPNISTEKFVDLPEEISNYEPAVAFDGGAFGVSLLMRFMKEAHLYLKPGGYLVFEIGLQQGKKIQKLLPKMGPYEQIKAVVEESCSVMVLIARTR